MWVSEWNAGQVGRYDPSDRRVARMEAARRRPQAYAVYVDELDNVWLTDFGANAIVRFDPATETFDSFPLTGRNAAVRQLLGRAGEVWGAESGARQTGGHSALTTVPEPDQRELQACRDWGQRGSGQVEATSADSAVRTRAARV